MSNNLTISRSFCIKSDLKNLPWLRDFVSKMVTDSGGGESLAKKSAVVITEAIDNAVIHAHRHDESYPITVFIEVEGKKLAIEVWDEGRGFNFPKEIKFPDVLSENGRGIAIMHHMSEELSYIKHGKKNCLRVVLKP